MSMNDTLSDMITRIRNGYSAEFQDVEVIDSKLNRNVLEVLKKHGYIIGFKVKEDVYKINVSLKYCDLKPCITKIKRVSKPGCRVYQPLKDLGSVFDGFGIKIISTSKGVMSDIDAKKSDIRQGGEILCEVV